MQLQKENNQTNKLIQLDRLKAAQNNIYNMYIDDQGREDNKQDKLKPENREKRVKLW